MTTGRTTDGRATDNGCIYFLRSLILSDRNYLSIGVIRKFEALTTVALYVNNRVLNLFESIHSGN